VGIHYDDGPGFSQDKNLLGMRRLWIGELLLGRLAPAMRAGHDARRAVGGREVVQQPDGIAYPEAGLVSYRAGIAV
jgi:hypothetical protein